MQFRPFRNADPPGLTEVWNESLPGRGAYKLHSPAPFDRWILSKPYFEPECLMVAVDELADNRIVGFALAGFAPNEERSAQEPGGVICCVLVRPSYRRKGIGTELLKKSEEYLLKRGADAIVFGAQRPDNPYMFGMYGGANSPGILQSEPLAEPFLKSRGYVRFESHLVFQRSLEKPLEFADGRFVSLRRHFDIQVIRPTVSANWWEECIWGVLEPTEFRIVEKIGGAPAGRLVNWDLDGFSARWNRPATGIFDVEIRAHMRRRGLAKFLLASVLKLLQDQFYSLAELQVWADDPAGVGICKALGFEQVDVGFRYRKKSSAKTE